MQAQRAKVNSQKERSPLAAIKSAPSTNSARDPGFGEKRLQSVRGWAHNTGKAATIRTSGGLTW